MKLGVSSYSFAKHIRASRCSYIDICNLAKEFGFQGIEFVDLDFPSFNITDNPLACAKEIRAHCDKIGLEIIAYTVGANLLAEDQDAEVDRLCRCVDVAEAPLREIDEEDFLVIHDFTDIEAGFDLA